MCLANCYEYIKQEGLQGKALEASENVDEERWSGKVYIASVLALGSSKFRRWRSVEFMHPTHIKCS